MSTILQDSVYALISAIKAEKPEVDLSDGTALKDLLINPNAYLHDYIKQLIDNLKANISLNSGNFTDEDIVKAILENYLISPKEGLKASGQVVLTLANGNIITYAGEDLIVSTVDGKQYKLLNGYTLLPEDAEEPTDGSLFVRIKYDSTTASYYVILPFISINAGSQYNIEDNIALTISDNYNTIFTDAMTYTSFTGGSDEEKLEDIIEDLPDRINSRNFTTVSGITGLLLDGYAYDVSVIRSGYKENRRARHNTFGIDTGGKCDIWLKTIKAPAVISETITATKIDDEGYYSLSMPYSKYGVIYKIKNINSPDSRITPLSSELIGSYPYVISWSAGYMGNVSHSFSSDPDEKRIEVFYSRWMELSINVGPIGAVNQDGTFTLPDTVELTVEYYVAPNIQEVQDMADAEAVFNDIVIKAAVPAFVSFNANIYGEPNINISDIKSALIDYINNLKIGETLSISALTGVAHQFNIKNILFSTITEEPNMISASFMDLDAHAYTLKGDILDIKEFSESNGLYTTEKTSMFVADPDSIFVNYAGVGV